MSPGGTLMYVAKATITKLAPQTLVHCRQCTRLHPEATRERCRQHAATLGHTVLFRVVVDTIYTRKEPS